MSSYEWAVLNGFLGIIRLLNMFLKAFLVSKHVENGEEFIGNIVEEEYETMLKQLAGKQ